MIREVLPAVQSVWRAFLRGAVESAVLIVLAVSGLAWLWGSL
jgi:hypothetical protein